MILKPPLRRRLRDRERFSDLEARNEVWKLFNANHRPFSLTLISESTRVSLNQAKDVCEALCDQGKLSHKVAQNNQNLYYITQIGKYEENQNSENMILDIEKELIQLELATKELTLFKNSNNLAPIEVKERIEKLKVENSIRRQALERVKAEFRAKYTMAPDVWITIARYSNIVEMASIMQLNKSIQCEMLKYLRYTRNSDRVFAPFMLSFRSHRYYQSTNRVRSDQMLAFGQILAMFHQYGLEYPFSDISELVISSIKVGGYDTVAVLLMLDSRFDPWFSNHLAFQESVQSGNAKALKLLLNHKKQPNWRSISSGVETAVVKNHTEVLKLLLGVEGVEVPKERRLLETAITNNNAEATKLMIKYRPEEIDYKLVNIVCAEGMNNVLPVILADSRFVIMNKRDNPIYIAVLNRKLETIKILLRSKRTNPAEGIILSRAVASSKILEVLINDPRVDPNYFNCVVEALEQNAYKSLELLLNHEKVILPDNILEEALFHSLKSLKILLKDPRIILLDHFPSLFISAARVDLRKFKFLMRYVDPSLNNNQLLRELAAAGELDALKQMLRNRWVNPGVCNNHAIILAAMNGHSDCVRLLMKDERVDPSAQNNLALQRASERGHYRVVKQLIKDSRVREGDMFVAFELAVDCNQKDVLELLIDAGVDPARYGDSALCSATKHGYLEVIELLLTDARVDPTKAIKIAIEQGYEEISKLLIGL